MKQYLGIITSIIYALLIRLLAEYNILGIDINSLAYLIIAPAVLGFIPFFFKSDNFYNNIGKAIYFPLIAVVLFLIIAIVTRIEDLVCLVIIGFPYALVSITVSIVLYFYFKKKRNGVSKNMMPLLLLPIIVGGIENELTKDSSIVVLSEKIIIHSSFDFVYDNLLEVPDLTEYQKLGLSNYLGVPSPKYSMYDKKSNIRKGFFENDIILVETVVNVKENSELVFKIDIDKSDLKNSPTLQHVLTTRGIEFMHIKYQLTKLDENKTELKLSTEFKINSNLNFYGRFWGELIIKDFEKNILNALKHKLETILEINSL